MLLLLFLLEMLQRYKLLPRAIILTLLLKLAKPPSKLSSCCISPLQIPIYLLNPLKTLYFQGISPILCSNLMCFPLFLPLRAETRESFLLSADHLIQQSCGSTLRFPCSVSVNIHCGTDIGVSEKLLPSFGAAPFESRLLVNV